MNGRHIADERARGPRDLSRRVLASVVFCCTPFEAGSIARQVEADGAANHDDASVEGGAALDGLDGGASKRVFVSSVELTGQLGSTPSDWDARCQALAVAAGLPGTFIAWVSTASSLAVARLGDGEREWLDMKGTSVAKGRAPLGRDLKITIDEKGAVVSPLKNVWTGTFADGGAADLNCDGWTSDDADEKGTYGECGAGGEKWSRAGTEECDFDNRLYCFEK